MNDIFFLNSLHDAIEHRKKHNLPVPKNFIGAYQDTLDRLSFQIREEEEKTDKEDILVMLQDKLMNNQPFTKAQQEFYDKNLSEFLMPQ